MAIISPTVTVSGKANPTNDTLARKLAAIPGARVSSYVFVPLGELIYEVCISECGMEAEMAVCRAEQEVYQEFPEARIKVYVV